MAMNGPGIDEAAFRELRRWFINDKCVMLKITYFFD
jgi:hypothetical protein